MKKIGRIHLIPQSREERIARLSVTVAKFLGEKCSSISDAEQALEGAENLLCLTIPEAKSELKLKVKSA